MPKTIVNLTLPVVNAEIEEILHSYSSHPASFSVPNLRQKLLSYVLCRIPGIYTVLDEAELLSVNVGTLCHAAEQRQQIDSLIHQGIQELMNAESQWSDRHTPPDSNMAPSSWFG
ncbi:hypothetical protein IQ268_05335 [Oculatella sp. LEGE 06141]|uniref:hypothetical protein n=1 Tax=Oculatella sp. LEGE 06141 TaxID=1828648 RepID=UPI00187F2C7D|nr:hypothetical protein [Oculatella sp. LEGE 06141]MBE9178007.1 hypothetical protein [Oculatella sp. LEGE 06141]